MKVVPPSASAIPVILPVAFAAQRRVGQQLLRVFPAELQELKHILCKNLPLKTRVLGGTALG